MAAYEEINPDRLEDEIPKAQFHEKITKKRMNTFPDIRKKTSASNSYNAILKADRNVLVSMVLVAESRDLRMSDVLSHSFGPLPWALANGDGTMRKTNKAALARELERQMLPAETIPQHSATIIDETNLVQKMKGSAQIISQLADSALTHILHEGVGTHIIDMVFDSDTHQEDSTKNAERSNKGSTTEIRFRTIAPVHRIQQWKEFLSSSAHKAILVRFLVAEWKTHKLMEKPNDKQLYIASDETCLHITNDE